MFSWPVVKQASDLLAEVRQSLLSARSEALTDLVEGRKDDGTVLLPEAEQQLQEPVAAVLETLQPITDDFGRQLPYIYLFRQQRRLAKEASSSSVAIGNSFKLTAFLGARCKFSVHLFPYLFCLMQVSKFIPLSQKSRNDVQC